MSPKIIPIGIKKIRGTNRKCREKVVVPPSEKIAQPPANLNPRAKQIFLHLVRNRLSGLGLASASYTEAIGLLSSQMQMLEDVNKVLNEKGWTYKTTNESGAVMVRVRPEVAIRKSLSKHVQSLMCEFGLTPSSAQKVGKPPEKKDKSGKERFFD